MQTSAYRKPLSLDFNATDVIYIFIKDREML